MIKQLLLLIIIYFNTFTLQAENTIPDFQFKNQNQTLVTPENFKGKYWVINFFFTSCPKICPMLNGKVYALSQKFKDSNDLAFLSISVDPERDTFPALVAYSKKFNTDLTRWQFARGSTSEVNQFVDRLKLATGPTINEHNARLTLVSPNGKILGQYSGLDQEGFQELDKKLAEVLHKE